MLHHEGWACCVRGSRRQKRQNGLPDTDADKPAEPNPDVAYTVGGRKHWWIGQKQTCFKRAYMMCLLKARQLNRPIPHNQTERCYECMLGGVEYVPHTRFKIYDGDRPPRQPQRPRKRRKVAAAPSSSSRSSSSSSSSSTSPAKKSSHSGSESSAAEPPAPPAPPPAPHPAPRGAAAASSSDAAAAPRAGGGAVVETTMIWKTFKFTAVRNEVELHVGWEVTCYCEPHRRQGPRCVRTLRFAKHKGREMTEHMLKWWCVAGFSSSVNTCQLHKKLPHMPDELPPLQELEAFEVPPEHVEAPPAKYRVTWNV